MVPVYDGWVGAISIAIMVVIMISASISDWKKREISDIHWVTMSLIGISLFVYSATVDVGFRWEYAVLSIATIMAVADLVWDHDRFVLTYYLTMALLFVIPIYMGHGDPYVDAWISIPVCYLFYLALYYLGIVRGGGDVKCLVALSVLFPIYPYLGQLATDGIPSGPFPQVLVFSVFVLFVASLLTICSAIFMVIRNVRDGNTGKGMFSGYRMPLSQAEQSHVWPLEDVVSGKISAIGIDDNTEEVYSRLRKFGATDVRVTPMVPFIIPMTVAAIMICTLMSIIL